MTKVTVDTASTGGVDNTTILLLEEVGPSSLGHLVGSAQVNVDDGVPQVVVHVVESLVTQDTCVVHEDINASECLNGRLDNTLAVFARGLVAHSLSTELSDLIDSRVRVDKVVNNDGSAVFGESQRVCTAKTDEKN